ncbi:TetR/AcrR family transcriptional regulator [Paenibacillus filicis]|uniref:TetR/AcrR family transcriptional regulator n=1 Tax=Paenibacillus filicis TaxID=669464 RepID=A0ABU9DGE6_9BACL
MQEKEQSHLCAESKQEQARGKLLRRMLDPVMKDGFQQMKMEDIAKHMDVSRATLYKHFSSKEEVIAGVVEIFVNYIEKLKDRTGEGDEESFGVWFQQLFEQAISLAGKISEEFLKDLQSAYPHLYEELQGTLNKCEQRSLQFYREGQQRGIFNPINEKFIFLQDKLLLRELINIKYLLVHQVTLQQVLNDYYQLKKIQLFKADKLSLVDDARIQPAIEHVVEKFNRSLQQ